MASIRTLLFSLCIVPLAVACGDDTGGDGDGGGTPTGEHYKYVAKEVQVPERASDPAAQGLDIDGDGMVDNQLGRAIATLGTALSNPTLASAAVDASVADGTIIILADFQTPDFQNADTAGLQVLLGANPTPAACTNPADPATCGQHLNGSASFEISADSPSDALLTGPLVNGTFKGGPGTVTLQIALSEGGVINLDLIGARVEGTGISATGGSFKVGGAVTETDFDTMVLPGIKGAIVDPLIEACGGGAAPTCGCETGSSGATVLSLLDENDDCEVTVQEIKDNEIVGGLLKPDVEINGESAISIGVVAVTTGATFTN